MDRRRWGILLASIGALFSAVLFPTLHAGTAVMDAAHFVAGLCLGLGLAMLIGGLLRRRGLSSSCTAPR